MEKDIEKKHGYVEIENMEGKSQLAIVDYIQSSFIGGRTITVAKLEDETYVLAVENTVSSGRALESKMRLTEESLLALIGSIGLYFHHNNIDVGSRLKEIIGCKEMQYTYTKND